MGKYVKILVILKICILVLGCSNRGEISMGIESFPNDLDPVKDYGFYTTQITNQIFETLISLDEDNKTIIPNLAIHWEQSNMGRDYTFKLRPGITFHDRRKLSAHDIRYSVNRYIKNREYWIIADIIREITVLDSFSIRISLKRSYSQFLYMLCSPYIFLVMQNDSQVNNDKFKPIGTGPYRLKSILKDQNICLEKYGNYWRQTESVKTIKFVPHYSTEERQSALINNDVDILYLISGYEIDRLRWTGKIDYCVNKSSNTLFFGFNLNDSPFDDIRVRKAVLYALDLRKIVHNLNRGNAQVARGPLPPVYRSENLAQQENYNPKKARLLLHEAGYPGGLRIRCNFPGSELSRQTLAEIVKTELAKSGIYIDPVIANTWKEHTDSIFSPQTQLFFDGSGSMFIGEPEYFLRTLFYSESRYNFFRYNNSLVDSLLDMAREENDKPERRKAYDLIVREIITDTPAVFFSHVIPHFAYNSKKIRKMSANPYRIVDFKCMELYE